jgi:ring-1,2-phenylacetyl-CoA epoxidase subunit PaaB
MAPTQVFEVFRQEEEGEPFRHAGSLLAPDNEMARLYARDLYGRRHESVRLWVVPRSAVMEVSDPDLLASQFDRTYREGAGYRITVDKRKNLRERVAAEKGNVA